MATIIQRLRTLLTEGASARAIPWAILALGLAISSVVFYQLRGTPNRVIILGGSLLVTTLVAGLVWSVTRSEAEARRRVEAATRDLRAAQRVARVGSWEWHVPSDTVTNSEQQHRLLGLDPEEVDDPGYEDFLQAVHPDDRDRVDGLVAEALETGEYPTFEFRVQYDDGSVRWMENRGEVETEDGEVVRMRGTNLDITDRTLPLRRLESLVETSRDAIVQADEDGEIVGWNEGAEAIFGYPEDEVLGEPLTVIMPEEYRQAHREGIQRFLETGEAHVLGRTVELEGLRADGTRFPIELTLDTYTVGEARYFSGIVRDITERKDLEEDLRDAKEEAEAADEAKSRFLASMSHEIRTPMNAIIGLTDILLDADLPKDERAHVEQIQASSEHLLSLIDDILDFSKIEAGELTLEEQAFDLRGTLEEAFQLVAPPAGEKRLELAYRYGDDVPEAVHGDPGRVRQILVNLLSNAVKYTEEGEVVARVGRLEDHPEVAPEGEEVLLELEVEDTGKGLEADDIEDLFDPFTQEDIGANRPQQGTGLGLAITRDLVEMMGGTIEAEGEPGEGSTFRVVVALAPAERPEPRTWKTSPGSLEGEKVLVVDDNETSRDIVSNLARRWGMDPVTAGSAEEAVDLLQKERDLAVAVLDYAMPGATGVDLARRMRDGEALPSLPVVVITSMPVAEAKVRETGLDIVDVLVKPVTPSDLFDALGAALSQDEAPDRTEPEGFDRELGDRLDLEILVVEDNAVNRQVILEILGRMGFEPVAVEDGQQALERLDEEAYDVVLMDVQMPTLDGLEATRRIRAELPDDIQPQIVALTAHAGAADRRRCLEAGMDDYLSKPMDKASLVEALERSVAPSGEAAGDGGP